MSEHEGERQAARAGVAGTAAAEPDRIRGCSATGLLALLSAAAIAPLAGAGRLALSAALAEVAGNVGCVRLAAITDWAAAGLAGGPHGVRPPGAAGAPGGADRFRDALAAGLLAELEKNDAAAQELRASLTGLLLRVDGPRAAMDASAGEARGHLQACFGELFAQQGEGLREVGVAGPGSERPERRRGLVARVFRERRPAGQAAAPPAAPGGPGATRAAPGAAGSGTWRGGAEIAVGESVYRLHDDGLEERFSADRSAAFRQARGLRLMPGGQPGEEYAWLRQAEVRDRTKSARITLGVLSADWDLLIRLGHGAGFPRLVQLEPGGLTATLVLGWPSSRSSGGPCTTLQASLERGRGYLDPWRMYRLFNGIAGLCGTVARLHDAGAAHRDLTPASIVVLDDGRLVLRDVGLASRPYVAGEGPAGYQAPEQQGGREPPGPPTDVYQLAAVAYHLVAGYPPDPRTHVPLRAQAPGVPDRISDGLAAALAPETSLRPDVRALGGQFRAACDDLR
jgi:hypothetical protein